MLSVRQAKYLVHCIVVLGLFAVSHAFAGTPEDDSSVVIFAYQRIGEDSTPQSNLSLDRFRSHLEEIKSSGYSVLPLEKAIEAIKAKTPIPQKSISITFDGAWMSTLNNAVPLLTENKIPFTVFFSSDMADTGSPNHMTWKEIKALKKNKLASFGIMPSSYARMPDASDEVNDSYINRAISRYREEMGAQPAFFAYPYGEHSNRIRKSIEKYSFSAAFGQYSGVAFSGSDFLALPRFTMTDSFGDLDRFTLTANALPLPVSDITPDDNIVTGGFPAVGFTVSQGIADITGISCFISGYGKVDTKLPGGNRVEIRLDNAVISDRRTRINCTIPDSTIIPGEALNWRWFGTELINTSYNEDTTVAEPPETE